jgi:hypothetical protein
MSLRHIKAPLPASGSSTRYHFSLPTYSHRLLFALSIRETGEVKAGQS